VSPWGGNRYFRAYPSWGFRKKVIQKFLNKLIRVALKMVDRRNAASIRRPLIRNDDINGYAVSGIILRSEFGDNVGARAGAFLAADQKAIGPRLL